MSDPEQLHRTESAWAATEIAPPGGGAIARPDVEENADALQRKRAIRARLFGDTLPAHRIGRYSVLSRLGAGGMGVVYSAYDETLERRVALKLVRTARAGDKDGGDRLRREGRAMARLSHPNIAQIYEVGEHEGQVFVAMEYVLGKTLTSWLNADADAEPQRRGWREVLALFIQAGRGLEAAHGQGLVHRDFKPDNVMIGQDGRVRVLDFGLARALASLQPWERASSEPASGSASSLDAPLTVTGAVLGTPAYMSPEQFAGRSVDAKSDQFSFCVSLYEALYGERPFAGSSILELANAVRTGSMSSTPRGAAVPGWIRAALARGLQAKPEDRWPSMTEVLSALDRDPARRWRRFGAVVLAGCVGGLGWTTLTSSEFADELGERVEQEEARADHEAERARSEAQRANELAREASAAARRARDRQRLVAARELGDDAAVAVNLLREVEDPDNTAGWVEAVNQVLRRPIAEGVFPHEGMVWGVDISPDGRWFVTTSNFNDGPDVRLWRSDGREPARTLGPAGVGTRRVIFSPRGNELAAAYKDGTIRMFAVNDEGEATAELHGHAGAVTALAYTHDGARLVSVGADGTVRVWDPAQARQLFMFEGPRGGVWHAALATDGQRVAIGGKDGSVMVRELEEHGATTVLRGHSGPVEFVDLSPDGARLLTASRDGTARLWSANGRGAPRVLRGHTGRLMAARFSPDGARALTSGVDGDVRIWSVEEAGEPTTLRGDGPAIMDAAFSADGESVAFGSASGAVFVGDAEGRREPVVLRGHTKKIHAIEFFPDGRVLSGSFDGDARVWRVPRAPDGLPTNGSSHQLARHRGLVDEIEYAPSGSRFATASMAGDIRVWNAGSLGPEYVLEHGGWVGQLAWSPDGDRLVSASDVGSVLLWDVASGPVATRTLTPGDATTLYAGEPRPVPIAWGSEGALVAIGGRDHEVRVESLETGVARGQTRVLAGLDGAPFRLVFSHDNTHLAAIDDGAALIWGLNSEGAPLMLRGHTGRMSTIAWSPDDRRVVTAAEDGTARVWDLGTPGGDGVVALDDSPRVLDTGTPEFTFAFFNPGGGEVVTASISGTVRVWSLDENGAPTVLEAGTMVFETAFSPDSRWIASAGEDSIVRLWTSDGAHGPFVLEGHHEGVRALAFSPDSRQLVTGGEDRTPLVWDLGIELDPSALQELLTRATTSCVSVEQRQRLLAEEREEAGLAHARCEERFRPSR